MKKVNFSITSSILSLALVFVSLGSEASLSLKSLSNVSTESDILTISDPEKVPSPSVNAGLSVKKYGNDFLYAHSHLAFSTLKTYSVGDEFAVETNGEKRTYQISRRETFSKSTLDENSGLRSAIYSANFRGNSYDLALMTCGNGENDDPNSRLVFFATQVK